MTSCNFPSIGKCFNHHRISLSKAVVLCVSVFFAVP